MPAPPAFLVGAPEWTPPAEFEGFRVVRPLGQGGMGQVYLGHDPALERHVALKFIASDDQSVAKRERFLVEARAIARLQHPNVVAVYRVGEVLGRPYIAYEFIPGESLDDIAKPVTWQLALRIGVGLARGLAAAHARGVLHRDIKPGNVMLAQSGEVKLLDFGIAKLIDEATGRGASDAPQATAAATATAPTTTATTATATKAATTGTLVSTAPIASQEDGPTRPTTLTRTGTLLGTPLYLPPELWSGSRATVRSDLYALGLVLYELCAGELPHEELDFEEMARIAPTTQLPGLRAVRPEVPEMFATILDRCLRLLPEERYASAEEVRDALEEAEGLFRTLGMSREEPRTGTPPENDEEARAVKASFERVAETADLLVARFYERLFLAHPQFRPLFPADLREQRIKFKGALQLTIENLQKREALEPLLLELGKRHAAYGVKPGDFEAVGAALIGAIKELDANAWNPTTERAWQSAYARFAEVMKRGLALA